MRIPYQYVTLLREVLTGNYTDLIVWIARNQVLLLLPNSAMCSNKAKSRLTFRYSITSICLTLKKRGGVVHKVVQTPPDA